MEITTVFICLEKRAQEVSDSVEEQRRNTSASQAHSST